MKAQVQMSQEFKLRTGICAALLGGWIRKFVCCMEFVWNACQWARDTGLLEAFVWKDSHHSITGVSPNFTTGYCGPPVGIPEAPDPDASHGVVMGENAKPPCPKPSVHS